MAVHAQSNIQLNTIPAYTSLLGGHFVYRAHGTPGTPASANVVESSINLSNPAQWGYNTHIGANGIKLRYNENDLSEWSTNGLTFYKPGSIDKSLQLSATDLKFFKPDSYQLTTDSVLDNSKNYYTISGEGTELSPYVYTIVTEPNVASIDKYYEQTTAATLNALGLNITDGSITLGEPEDNIYPFRVNSEGYLTAREGWIGGIDSYVKLEKDEETNSHYLDVRLSQLDMLLGGDLYGQENIVDVLDIVAQQSDFIRLWTGEQVWLYYKDGEGTEPYIVYQYTDNETGKNRYYYDINQFLEGQYFPSKDGDFLDKEYYKRSFDDIKYPTGIPKEQEYYESDGDGGYQPTSDEAVEYILSSDEEVKDDKIYYEKITKVGIETYIEIENPSGNPSAQHFYETKTYFIVDYSLVEERGNQGPKALGYYEPYVSEWQEYVDSIDNLQVMSIAGLSQSLKFTDDSLGNQQRFIVSSANDTNEEKLKIEIDPHYLKFLVESEENPSLEMSLNYNTSSDSNSLLINSGSDNLFSVEDNTGYALSTTTGFKAGPLGMFHYKDGLVIGLI